MHKQANYFTSVWKRGLCVVTSGESPDWHYRDNIIISMFTTAVAQCLLYIKEIMRKQTKLRSELQYKIIIL